MPRVLSCSREGSEKEIDLGWSLVSSITCLWDRWLLGDRCKMTIDDSVISNTGNVTSEIKCRQFTTETVDRVSLTPGVKTVSIPEVGPQILYSGSFISED